MKVVSFNINSIRARLHQLAAIIEQHQPDVIGLQETKVSDEDFPLDAVSELGYHIEFHGQKGHYGVAMLTKEKPVKVIKGFITDEEDAQRRAITTVMSVNGKRIAVFNGYFPQGESRDHPTKFPAKEKYYQDLYALTKSQSYDHFIIMGDFNVSHTDNDIGIGEKNAKRWLKTGKCSFLPEEREWLDSLMALGYVDTFRKLHPEEDNRFSWFDYRSKGFDDDPRRGLRIDLILADTELAALCSESDVDYVTRGMEKPSDHCPIWSTFSL